MNINLLLTILIQSTWCVYNGYANPLHRFTALMFKVHVLVEIPRGNYIKNDIYWTVIWTRGSFSFTVEKSGPCYGDKDILLIWWSSYICTATMFYRRIPSIGVSLFVENNCAVDTTSVWSLVTLVTAHHVLCQVSKNLFAQYHPYFTLYC